MKTLTLAEFDRYIKEKKPTLFIYNNREIRNTKGWYELLSFEEPLFLSLTFDSISICYHPSINTVNLKGKSGQMQLSCIEKINVKENDTMLGDTVIIHTKTETATKTYTIIMR